MNARALVRNEVIRRLGERVPRQRLPRKAPWWSRDDPPVGAAAIAGAGGVVHGGIGSSDCRCWVHAADVLSMAPCRRVFYAATGALLNSYV